jgi:ABC-2 type transport system ATP-binding protein
MGQGSGDRRVSDSGSGAAAPVLSVRNVRKSYRSGGAEVTAVDGVSFDIRSGSIVGLLGHNGAGKTTLIKTILGLVTPTEGTVRVRGTDVQRGGSGPSESVAAVLEGARNTYWRLTVEENLNYFARIAGHSASEQVRRHDRLLDQLGLADRSDTQVNELSRGMKQKVAIATMLAREPDLLFLDEPTMGLDVESSLALRTEIERIADSEDITVVISSHNMEVIEALCDRVIILNDGRIAVDDTVERLRDLFESHSLELTVDGSAPESLRTALEGAYEVESWEEINGRTRISVRLDAIERIQDVLARVFDAEVQLLDVQTAQIDMEDIYLEAIDSSHDREPTRDGIESYA